MKDDSWFIKTIDRSPGCVGGLLGFGYLALLKLWGLLLVMVFIFLPLFLIIRGLEWITGLLSK